MSAVLELSGVAKSFGGLHVLRDVSLAVERGELAALIGPNGAGKTTVFNIIACTLAADRGEVRLLGRDARGLSAHAACRLGVARTFQLVRVFPSMSCLENVLAGFAGRGRPLGAAERREAGALLERVGLAAKAATGASGLTVIEKKRLELARALACAPELLLLDELLAGLNPAEVDSALALIGALRAEKGLTILWIEHNLRAVMKAADRVFVLDQGAVIASGAPQHVVGDPRVVEAYLGAPHA